MLTALEKGVKGGRWYSLIDKVYKPITLQKAYRDVERNKGAAGVDHVTVEAYGDNLEKELEKLRKSLMDGSYRPQKIRRVMIPKPGSKEKRPLGIPTVRDRVVQTALRKVLEPIFEKEFAEHSYGFRPKRGCKDALRRVDQLLREGYTYTVDADLRNYFGTIPHAKLMERLEEKISDRRILELIELFLKQRVMDGMKEWTPEEGTPQGAVLSPLLSNIYLNPLDHEMAESGYEMVRYADDFIILCRSRAEAEAAMERAREWTKEAGLLLHPEKSGIRTLAEGFDFLGYHFQLGRRSGKLRRWPRKKSMQKVKDTIRAKTKRNNGHSMKVIIQDLNTTLRSWFEYFKHSNRQTFIRLDQWIRGRLRSILRKRAGGKGRGRGSDHQRWRISYFAEAGLFSLVTAHALASQSSRR